MSHRSPSAQQRILRAARTEFAVHGPAGARTRRIAELAAVNKQLLHYYFGTREGLYQALLADAGGQIAAAMSQIRLIGLTAVERLRRLLGAEFDLLARERELTRLLLQAPGPAAWADTAAAPLVNLLTEGQATGFFRDDIDPAHHARQAMVLHLGYFALEPITRAWAGPAAWRDRTTELVVRGCTW